nr:transposase, mutator type [Tanacetum cinerariifolium]
EEHVVDEVEVNMNNFKFQIDEEDESSGNDAIVPNVNVIEHNLEVLDFDSLESDLEDVPENAKSLGLRKLKKKHSSSKFFIGSEFVNKDLAKDLIRDHVVESRRNLHFLRNDKRRIRVVCNGVVPSKNVIIDKVQRPAVGISAFRVFTSRFRPPSRLVVAARDAKTAPTVWFSRRGLVFSPMAQATSHRTLCSNRIRPLFGVHVLEAFLLYKVVQPFLSVVTLIVNLWCLIMTLAVEAVFGSDGGEEAWWWG